MDESINELKKQVAKYNALSDYDKIMSDEYMEIINEKEACCFMVNDYKTRFANINDRVYENLDCDDNMFGTIMKKINTIKHNMNDMNDNKNMDEIIDMYGELCKYKNMLKKYFDNKKMEVINI